MFDPIPLANVLLREFAKSPCSLSRFFARPSPLCVEPQVLNDLIAAALRPAYLA
jgi:hypothetical protein